MPIVGIDHVSGHLHDREQMVPLLAWYRRLGFEVLHEDEYLAGNLDKCSISAGDNKMNVRPGIESGVTPHVGWRWSGGIDTLVEHLHNLGVEIYRGPLRILGGRDGGLALGIGVVVHDPDGAPVAFVSYDEEDIAKYPGPTYEDSYREAARGPDKAAGIAAFLRSRTKETK